MFKVGIRTQDSVPEGLSGVRCADSDLRRWLTGFWSRLPTFPTPLPYGAFGLLVLEGLVRRGWTLAAVIVSAGYL